MKIFIGLLFVSASLFAEEAQNMMSEEMTQHAQSLIEDMKKSSADQTLDSSDAQKQRHAQQQAALAQKAAQNAYEFRTEFWKDRGVDAKNAAQ